MYTLQSKNNLRSAGNVLILGVREQVGWMKGNYLPESQVCSRMFCDAPRQAVVMEESGVLD